MLREKTEKEIMSELDQYDYDLPRELIAQYPVLRRSDARLLLVQRAANRLSDHYVRDLPELLRPGDCLVLNDTKVIPARLVGVRDRTSGHWEGLFLEADEHGLWRMLCKTRGKLEPGECITLLDRQGNAALTMRLVTRLEGGQWIGLPQEDEDALSLLNRVGRAALPPYIRGGKMTEDDLERYQTVYAERPGAVAAPTAGLHFTPELLRQIEAMGIPVLRVTLHVGIGTFRPIVVERLSDHVMHAEWGEISAPVADQLNAIRARGGRIIAVGTTSVRLLESATRQGRIEAWSGHTDLFIRPPYTFQAVDALMTNFHLPKSTLLILVRTFGGDALMRRAYEHAIRERYRFFSYGDAMLIV